MSKGPTPRHSKSPKPVTIDLDATDVTPKNADLKANPAATGPSAAKKADPAKPEEPAKSAETGGAAATPGKSASGPKSAAATTAAPDPKPSTSSTPKPSMPSKAAASETASSKAPESKTAGSATAASQAADPKRTQTGSTPPKAAGSGTAGSASAKSPAESSKSNGGGLGMVMSGIIGAVIALGGGYALQAGGVLPAPGTNGSAVAPVASRVDELSSQVETLKQQLAGSAAQNGSGISAELAARLDSLESGLAAVTAKTEGTEGAVGDPEAVAAVEQQLAGLESKIAALGDGNAAVDPELAAGMNELRAAQSGMQAALDELKSGSAALSEKITALETSQQALAQQVEAPARQIDLARAIAAAGLKSAIDRGGSFMSELEAFASVAPDDPAVTELRDLAARGVPSRSDLVAGFSDAASKAIAAADPGNPEAGLVDRLMSSAMSVVKVRKVGDVPGDSAEAIVARAEARLLNGDLDAAVSEWNTLPEASLAATAEYGDALAARARAEKLIAAAVAPSAAASPSQAPAD